MSARLRPHRGIQERFRGDVGTGRTLPGSSDQAAWTSAATTIPMTAEPETIASERTNDARRSSASSTRTSPAESSRTPRVPKRTQVFVAACR